jgi:glucose-6-phosphate 1-dehydrogenase
VIRILVVTILILVVARAFWRVVEGILDLDDQPCIYSRGSWGPLEANDIVGEHRWHSPGGGG